MFYDTYLSSPLCSLHSLFCLSFFILVNLMAALTDSYSLYLLNYHLFMNLPDINVKLLSRIIVQFKLSLEHT